MMSKDSMDGDLDTEEWVFGEQVVTVNYEVKIAKFHEKAKHWKPGRVLHSKIFSVGHSRFQFNIYPSGRSEDVRSHVSVNLHNLNPWDVLVTYSFTAGTVTHSREQLVIRRHFGIGKHDFMDHKDRYILINRNFELFANISLLKEQVVVTDQFGSFLAIKQSMRKELSGLEMQLKAIQSKLETAGLSRPCTPSCPVCVADLSPPAAITQCRRGHLACGACTSRLSVCPTCEGAWTGRAVGLESFLGLTGQRV